MDSSDGSNGDILCYGLNEERSELKLDWDGCWSPLTLARERRNTDVVKLLEDYRDSPHKYRGNHEIATGGLKALFLLLIVICGYAPILSTNPYL